MSDPSLLLALTNLGETVEFDVGAYTGGAAQVSLQSPAMAWGSAVVAVEQSLDGIQYYALKPDPVNFTAEDMSWRLDISGVSKIRFRVTTVSGGTDFPVAVCTFHGILGT